MSHLLILCEDELGQYVLEHFLEIYWKRRFKTVDVISYKGNTKLKNNFVSDSVRELTTESDLSVLCLVDLYEEPFGIYQPSKMTHEEGFKLLQQHMYRLIQEKAEERLWPRFGVFPVVMEIETWLLADPEIQVSLNQHIDFPEKILHPARTMEEVYEARKSKYLKVDSGLLLFQKASAKRIYDDNCPHFKLMIDWITNPPQDKKKEQITEREQRWYAQLAELEAQIDGLWQQFEASEDPAIEEQLKAAEDERDRFSQTYADLFKN